MTEASVATKVHKTLFVHVDFATKVTFNGELTLENVADSADFILVDVIRLLVRRYVCLAENYVRSLATDSVNVS
tara:strand:- start:11617 stop:11838 length:222 start_codon:yes stop_codon:yes gene_type:complete